MCLLSFIKGVRQGEKEKWGADKESIVAKGEGFWEQGEERGGEKRIVSTPNDLCTHS